jgi:hypothetical protein
MLRPLYITDEIVKAAEAVKAYAFAKRENTRQIANRMATNAAGPANDDNHILYIPVGYRVVVSVEQHPEAGWLIHFAFSVEKDKGHVAYPSPKSVQHILRQCFGVLWNQDAKNPNPIYPDIAQDIWEERGEQHLLFKTVIPATSP